jgi:hypothetical protein
MQGSLDEPPIIIKQDQGKFVLGLFLIAGSVATFAAMGWGADLRQSIWVFAGFALGGLSGLMFMRNFVPPCCLALDESGLTWHGPWTVRRYQWSAFTGFAVVSPLLLARQPGCVFAASTEQRPIIRRLFGDTASFGPCWEMKAQEIVDLLDAARARWSGMVA